MLETRHETAKALWGSLDRVSGRPGDQSLICSSKPLSAYLTLDTYTPCPSDLRFSLITLLCFFTWPLAAPEVCLRMSTADLENPPLLPAAQVLKIP